MKTHGYQPFKWLRPLAFLVSLSANFVTMIFFVTLLSDIVPVGFRMDAIVALIPTETVLVYVFFGNVLPYILVIAAILWYFRPIGRWIKQTTVDPTAPRSDLVARRLQNYPLVTGLWGIAGWAIAWVTVLVQRHLLLGTASGLTAPHYLTSSFIQFLGSGLMTFVFSYYILEFINRRYFIPRAFPEGILTTTPGVIRLSIRIRFLMLGFAISAFPLLVLAGTLSLILQTEPLARTALVFIAIYLPTGIGLTFLVSRFFQSPLLEMKEATQQIRRENYDVTVSVTSSDEMGHLGEGINTMAGGLRDREKIKDTFGKMVDPAIRDHLLAGNLELGGQLRPAAILFSDLRDFTTLSENLPPAVVVPLLNRYFARMNVVIARHGGLVNKFMGDAIMALFNVPLPREQYAQASLQAALDMQTELSQLNREFQAEGLPELRMGIGLHAGEVLAGNIGSPQRMEYTVIGDPVNAASRIESLTKDYQRPILLSGQLLALIPARTGLSFDQIDSVAVKGKTHKIDVYAVAQT